MEGRFQCFIFPSSPLRDKQSVVERTQHFERKKKPELSSGSIISILYTWKSHFSLCTLVSISICNANEHKRAKLELAFVK